MLQHRNLTLLQSQSLEMWSSVDCLAHISSHEFANWAALSNFIYMTASKFYQIIHYQ